MAKRSSKRVRPELRAPSLRRRLFRLATRLFLTGLILGILTFLAGYWYFSQGLPDFDRVTDYRPAQVSRVFAADGTVLATFGSERRTVIARDKIPEVLVQAVLAAEDAEFFKHEGLDYTGMLRALYNSLRAGRVTGSGSTITQQTVKNLVLTSERSFGRKAREIILTRRLEQKLSKDDILAIYLNTIYLGHGRYGVQEAAQYYFGKDAWSLGLNEAATLAGIIQSPERHSPRKHYDAAIHRRAYVLDQMVKNSFITPEAAAEVGRAGIPLVEVAPERVDDAMWFVNLVKRQIIDALGEDALYAGGLRIYTSLDPARQEAAIAALRTGLRAMDERQKFAKPLAHVADDEVERWRDKRRKALGGEPPPDARPVPARLMATSAQGLVFDTGIGTATVSRDNARRFADDKGALPFRVGDVLLVAIRADGPRHPERMNAVLSFAPQGAMVVLDPRDRSVLALVGGWSYDDYPFDRTTQARRQPGSSFKPFVFGAALESQRYTPATLMLDAPETWQMQPGKWWKPKNYDGKFSGELNVRTALARSINTVAIKLTDEIGISAVQSFARRAGISSPLADNLTIALGSSEVAPLELANAYATIAVDGLPGTPRFIERVEGPDGPVAIRLTPVDQEDQPDQTLPADVTWLLRSLMRSVVTAGSGTALKNIKRTVVGKTGTSNDARDTWFVALLPDVVVTTWIGFDTPQSLGRKETGGRAAAPVVRDYLEKMETTGADWSPAPATIEAVEVDPVTGLRATESTPNKYLEYFLRGTAPTVEAPSRGEVDANHFMMEQLGLDPGEAAGGGDPLPVPPLPDDVDPVVPRPGRPVEPADPELPRPSRGLAPIAPIAARPAEVAPVRPAVGVPAVRVAPVPDGPPPVDAPDDEVPEELPPLDPPDDDEDRPE
ncbi:MAG: PBP1A family penicillin-binding protein [bacterium]